MARKSRRTRKTMGKGMWAFVIFSLVFLIGSVCFAYFTLKENGSQIFIRHYDVDIPDFTGKRASEVLDKDDYAGFRLVIQEEYNAEVPKGLIYDQTPDAPKIVKDNAKIVLFVSKGPKMVQVPEIVGLTYGDAMRALQEVGLVVTRETDRSGEFEQNTISKVQPEEGTTLVSGSDITIYVSSPVTVSYTKVPNLSNMNYSTAKATIAAYGLRLGTVSQVLDMEHEAGLVVGQSLTPNSTVNPGAVINISVAYGLVSETRHFRIELPYKAPSGKTTYKVTFYDKNGKKIADYNNRSRATGLTLERKGSIDEDVLVKIDGVDYRKLRLDFQNDTHSILEDYVSANGFILDPPIFNVVVTGNFGGSFSYPNTAEQGSTLVINIYPLPGFRIVSVLDNDLDVTDQLEGNTYRVSDVQGTHDVYVTFEMEEDIGGEDEP